MDGLDSFRVQARATWSAGDWDGFARLLTPVGRLVVDRVGVEPGLGLLDVGTGTGGNVAIPAAQLGAEVVGLDITPELLTHARRRAADAGVVVGWIEGDAQELPFADASFDRVTSTFGAMFAPDHGRTAAELVRVCRPGGRIVMTTWVNDGFVGELFTLTGSFMPAPPPVRNPRRSGASKPISTTCSVLSESHRRLNGRPWNSTSSRSTTPWSSTRRPSVRSSARAQRSSPGVGRSSSQRFETSSFGSAQPTTRSRGSAVSTSSSSSGAETVLKRGRHDPGDARPWPALRSALTHVIKTT